MILHEASLQELSDQIRSGILAKQLTEQLAAAHLPAPDPAQVRSWRDTLPLIHTLLEDSGLHPDIRAALEYVLPLTMKRADLILTGKNRLNQDQLVILEIKLWTRVRPGTRSDHIRTLTGGKIREVLHPALQAEAYASLLRNWNQKIRKENIQVAALTWLPLMDPERNPGFDLRLSPFAETVTRTPVFESLDLTRLQRKLRKLLICPADPELLSRIDQSPVSPDPEILNRVRMTVFPSFPLSPVQNRIRNHLFQSIRQAKEEDGTGSVTILEGGPDSGKTTLALDLTLQLTRSGLSAFYCPSSGILRPEACRRLGTSQSADPIQELIRLPASFRHAVPDACDVLIIDDARRLICPDRPLSDPETVSDPVLRRRLRSPDTDSLIRAARHSVFLLDESLQIALDDGGTVTGIREAVKQYNLEHPGKNRILRILNLTDSECHHAGGMAFLQFVNRITGEEKLKEPLRIPSGFEVRIFAGPASLRNALKARKQEGYSVRLTAGFCWPTQRQLSAAESGGSGHKVYKEENNQTGFRIASGYRTRWRQADEDPGLKTLESCRQIQGQKADWVGVLIGPDLICRDGKILTEPFRHSPKDPALGHLQERPHLSPSEQKEADRLIRNAYRLLLTRGIQGCYLWCADRALRKQIEDWLKESGTL